MPIEAFNQFRSYVATEIRELDFTVENEIMYKDLKSSIENIQNEFVITYVDKVSDNYAIICKYFYSKILSNHILNNNSFQKSIRNNREDDNRLLALNKRLNIHLNNIKYPSIFLTPVSSVNEQRPLAACKEKRQCKCNTHSERLCTE
ncbi:hypothetical protein TNCV_1575811 [Trichonephila clavipes]|nr:hypothetical protein TNCV_1575811 [Trichonephila clavipes]